MMLDLWNLLIFPSTVCSTVHLFFAQDITIPVRPNAGMVSLAQYRVSRLRLKMTCQPYHSRLPQNVMVLASSSFSCDILLFY
jgi:hypothetical protein